MSQNSFGPSCPTRSPTPTSSASTAADPRTGPAEAPGAADIARELEASPLYSEELGIDLSGHAEAALFRWFLASLLFGARIGEAIAARTYRAFVGHGLTDPTRILAAGWNVLVDPIMREGGYVRYDGRKSTQILRDCAKLRDDYGGRLGEMHARAAGPADLERRLDAFYGVGPVTVNIFLRELRPHWAKSDPAPLPIVRDLAARLGVDLAAYPAKSVAFARVEAGLLRRRHRRPTIACATPQR